MSKRVCFVCGKRRNSTLKRGKPLYKCGECKERKILVRKQTLRCTRCSYHNDFNYAEMKKHMKETHNDN